jgi:hypothetical protein
MITNFSRIESFSGCRRKYYFSYVLNLRETSESIDLHWGTAMHDGANAIVKGIGGGQPKADILHNALTIFNKTLTEKVGELVVPEAIEKCAAMQRLGEATLEHYFETWREPFSLVREEVEGYAEIGPHHLCFRIDGVIIFRRSLLLLERKTLSKSVSIENFLAVWHLLQQAPTYCIAFQKQTNLNPAGFILEVIRKTTTPEIYRETYLKTDEQKTNLEAELVFRIDEMEKAHSHSCPANSFYREPSLTNCFAYYRKCPFFNLCLEDRTTPMEGEFTTRPSDYVDGKRSESGNTV